MVMCFYTTTITLCGIVLHRFAFDWFALVLVVREYNTLHMSAFPVKLPRLSANTFSQIPKYYRAVRLQLGQPDNCNPLPVTHKAQIHKSLTLDIALGYITLLKLYTGKYPTDWVTGPGFEPKSFACQAGAFPIKLSKLSANAFFQIFKYH